MRTLIILSFVSIGWGQSCGIETASIKPATPIGCNDTAHACVCSGGSCFWKWVCLTSQQPVSNGTTSDPLSVFQGPAAQPTKPFDVGAYQDQRARTQAETNALNAAAAESAARTAAIIASPQMQSYLQRIVARHDTLKQQVTDEWNARNYSAALSYVSAGLAEFPTDQWFRNARKNVKSRLKQQKRAQAQFETHEVTSRP